MSTYLRNPTVGRSRYPTIWTTVYLKNNKRILFYQNVGKTGELSKGGRSVGVANSVKRRAEHHLANRYGFDRETASRIVASRVGPCEICGRISKRMVDHDHATGKIRGLLCARCNTGLPLLEDEKLKDACQRYLLQHGD